MKRMFLFVTIMSTLALSLGVQTANAQILRRRVAVTQPAQATRSSAAQQTAAQNDLFLANWIAADNQTEITLNQFASERASNPGVKNFAQEMIRAHSELATKLNQTISGGNAAAMSKSGQMQYTAGYRGADGAAQPQAENAAPNTAANAQPTVPEKAPADQPEKTAPAGAKAATQQPAGQQAAPAAATEVATNNGSVSIAVGRAGESQTSSTNFNRQINEQMVKLVEQDLGQKKGEDFDRCFIGGQVAAHKAMLATLEVAQSQASPQLKAVLDDAKETTQKHLSHAESLMTKLEPQQSR